MHTIGKATAAVLAAVFAIGMTTFFAIAHVLIPGGVGIGQELAWLRKFDSGIAS
jgi:hypothetical protein